MAYSTAVRLEINFVPHQDKYTVPIGGIVLNARVQFLQYDDDAFKFDEERLHADNPNYKLEVKRYSKNGEDNLSWERIGGEPGDPIKLFILPVDGVRFRE